MGNLYFILKDFSISTVSVKEEYHVGFEGHIYYIYHTGSLRCILASLKLSYFLNSICEKSETLLNCTTDASQRVHML